MFKRKLLVCALAIVSAVLVCFCTLTACGSGADTRYTVTFALDGGMMDGKAEVRVAEGSMLELSDYLPHKTGSSFVCWQAEDTIYTGNETLTVEADITLTALWRLNRYTVTFKD